MNITSEPILPDSSSYLNVSLSDREARLTGVGELGIATGSAFPLIEHCDGYVVPPGVKDVSGCPSEPVTHVAFSPVRRMDGVSELWESRKILISYGPSGRSVTTYRVLLSGADDEWQWLRDGVLVVFD